MGKFLISIRKFSTHNNVSIKFESFCFSVKDFDTFTVIQ